MLSEANLYLGKTTTVDEIGEWTLPGLHAVSDILLHAITNSVDHGFVLPLARGEAVGNCLSFEIMAERRGHEAVITIVDNGAGFNVGRIRAVAAKQGIDTTRMGEKEVLSVLLTDRFSTTDQVSLRSGRGVGLSAVNMTAKKLGGRTDLGANPAGRGTKITVVVPIQSVAVATVTRAAS